MPTQEKPRTKTENGERPKNSLKDLIALAEFKLEEAKTALSNAADNPDLARSIQMTVTKRSAIRNTLRDRIRPGTTEQALAELQGKLADVSDPSTLSEMARQDYAANNDALVFLGENANSPLDEMEDFKKWRQEKSHKEQAARQARTAGQRQSEKTTSTAEVVEIQSNIQQIWPEDRPNSRRAQPVSRSEQTTATSTERERTRERMIQAVMRDGGFLANTSWFAEISPDGKGGFKEKYERLRIQRNTANPLYAREKPLEQMGIDESVVFLEETVPETEQVNIPAKKNWLGMITEAARTETRWTGKSRTLMHAETVQNGSNEPSVRVMYTVQMSDPIHNQWRDYSGRGGQFLSLDISLPKSVAIELQKAVQADPPLIRQIVEKVMREKILGPGKAEAWTKAPNPNSDPLRPPYERMARQVYIQPMEEQPGKFTWHDEYLHPI